MAASTYTVVFRQITLFFHARSIAGCNSLFNKQCLSKISRGRISWLYQEKEWGLETSLSATAEKNLKAACTFLPEHFLPAIQPALMCWSCLYYKYLRNGPKLISTQKKLCISNNRKSLQKISPCCPLLNKREHRISLIILHD
jgi:hypothetical protein